MLSIPKKATFFLFFSLLLCGCSTQARNKFLRTFFDGVPESIAKSPANKEGEEDRVMNDLRIKLKEAQRKGARLYLHPPYSEKECDACHNSKTSQRVSLKGKELCFSCHDDFTKSKKVVHPPVEEGACIDCHDPHQSGYKYLLKEDIPSLCFTCHEAKGIVNNSMHQGENICTECHNPHASNEEKLLK